MSLGLLCAVKFEGVPTDPRHIIQVPVSLTSRLGFVQGQVQCIIQETTQKLVVILGLYPASIAVPGDSHAAAALVDSFTPEPHSSLGLLGKVSKHWSAADFAVRRVLLIVEAREIQDSEYMAFSASSRRPAADRPPPAPASPRTAYLRRALRVRADAVARYSALDVTDAALVRCDAPSALADLRPPSARAAPIALFHPAFASFLREAADPLLPTPAIGTAELFEFMHAAGGAHSSADTRARGVFPLLTVLTGFEFAFAWRGHTAPAVGPPEVYDDDDDGYHPPVLIAEHANELGSDDGDPLLRVAARYAESVTSPAFAHARQRSCCPLLLVALAGPYLCVLGGVFAARGPAVEPLTDLVLCLERPEDAGARIALLARTLQALRNAHLRLAAHYAALPSLPADPPIFPYRTSWAAGDTRVEFAYERPVVDDEHSEKLMWFATMAHTHEPLVVKFTKRYDAEAHALLAAAGRAPRLNYADPPSAPGAPAEWRMVVMAHITAVNYRDAPRAAMPALRADVRAAVALLHAAGRVHGDLFLENVLIEVLEPPTETQVGVEEGAGEGAGRARALLIDFDWAGPEGVARYPHNRNDIDIYWPAGSVPGGPILRAHDEARLELIDELWSRYCT
ncbi:hypothetical protein DFH11DRAFT_1744967 [Phellopilus nigrolimitatus]|nr:hypothetical protein DFH11DRAFT_1744967 [Phellopilus nigrolimitatus]